MSGAAIKDINARPTAGRSNNNTNNEVNANTLEALGVAIKDTNAERIAGKTNNNMDTMVDAGVILSRTISKIDTKLTVSGLRRANTIVEKEVYESNLI